MPKITPQDLQSQIACEYSTTLDKAFEGCPTHARMRVVTQYVLVLKNGYVVTGESSCVSDENFDAEMGRSVARADAVGKLWPLLGYELRTKIAKVEAARPLEGKIADMGGKTYIGTKVIHAAPMTRAAYNELRGWKLPEDENGDDEGYLVQYADQDQVNVPGFTGYVSWSPREVFENAYEYMRG